MNFDIRIDGNSLDLYPNTTCGVNKTGIDWTDITKRQATRTNTLKLPLTDRNRTLLGIYEIEHESNEIFSTQRTAEVLTEGLPVIKGIAYITRIGRQIELSVIEDRGLVGEISDAGELINTLDFSQYPAPYSTTNHEGVVNALANWKYGAFLPSTDRVWGVERTPCVFIKTILKKIFPQATFTGHVLNDAAIYKNAAIILTKDKTNTATENATIIVDTGGPFSITFSRRNTIIPLKNILSDINGLWDKVNYQSLVLGAKADIEYDFYTVSITNNRADLKIKLTGMEEYLTGFYMHTPKTITIKDIDSNFKIEILNTPAMERNVTGKTGDTYIDIGLPYQENYYWDSGDTVVLSTTGNAYQTTIRYSQTITDSYGTNKIRIYLQNASPFNFSHIKKTTGRFPEHTLTFAGLTLKATFKKAKYKGAINNWLPEMKRIDFFRDWCITNGLIYEESNKEIKLITIKDYLNNKNKAVDITPFRVSNFEFVSGAKPFTKKESISYANQYQEDYIDFTNEILKNNKHTYYQSPFGLANQNFIPYRHGRNMTIANSIGQSFAKCYIRDANHTDPDNFDYYTLVKPYLIADADASITPTNLIQNHYNRLAGTDIETGRITSAKYRLDILTFNKISHMNLLFDNGNYYVLKSLNSYVPGRECTLEMYRITKHETYSSYINGLGTNNLN